MSERVPVALFAALLLVAACGSTASPPAASGSATPFGTTAAGGFPLVAITAPAPGATGTVGQELLVTATASDTVGVTRIDLQADGIVVDTYASAVPAGQPSVSAQLGWTPGSEGAHALLVVAYRQDGTTSPPAVLAVAVVAGGGSTALPSSEPSAEPSASTPSGGAPTPALTAALTPTPTPRPTRTRRPTAKPATPAPTTPPPPTSTAPPTASPTVAPTATACLSSGFPDLVADLTAAYDAGSPIIPQVHLEFTVKNAGAGLACGSTVAVTCGNRTSTAGVPALAQNEAITVKMDFSPIAVLKPKTSLIVLDSTNAVQEFEGEANNDYTTVTLVTFCG